MAFTLENKRAVLFDMDGVLYDSMPLHSKAWSMAMADFGFKMSPADVYQYEGCTGAYTINMICEREGRGAVGEEEVMRIYGRKTHYFMEMPPAPMMPGAYEVMQKAKASGFQIQVVTGSGQGGLIDRVQRDYAGFVTRSLMVTAFDVKRGKPYPDPYLKGLETGGVSTSEAVVVENAPMGIRSAVAAGIDTIAVNTGPLDDIMLMQEGPAVLYNSMTELADAWDSLL